MPLAVEFKQFLLLTATLPPTPSLPPTLTGITKSVLNRPVPFVSYSETYQAQELEVVEAIHHGIPYTMYMYITHHTCIYSTYI